MKKIVKFISCILAFLLWNINATLAQGPFNIISTVAGDSSIGYNGDGIPASRANLYSPIGLAISKSGNIYISDTYDYMIRMVDTNGLIHTLVGAYSSGAGFGGDGGPDTNAKIGLSFGITIDTIGNIYFVDEGNARIRKIDTFGTITTIAGTGLATYNGDNIAATAANIGPADLLVDDSGNVIFSDGNNNRIRKINTSGIITTIAGNGTYSYGGDGGTSLDAAIGSPYGIAFDQYGNLFVAQTDFNVVRKIDFNGNITTVAGCDSLGSSGDGGPATLARLAAPIGISVDNLQNIYICDRNNYKIRIITPDGVINTFGGTGSYEYNGDGIPCYEANMDPVMIKLDKKGNLFFTDFNNSRVRKINNPLIANSLSVDEFSVSIFPNPNFGAFNVKVSCKTNKKIKLIIYNIFGENIEEMDTFTNMDIHFDKIYLSGMYVVMISNDSQIATEKLFVY